jgi:uncharacterized protein YcbK (DUF882 family)
MIGSTPSETFAVSRRHALGLIGGGLLGLMLDGDAAAAALPTKRSLAFVHTHTREHLEIVYADASGYLAPSLQKVNELLRDFRTEQVHAIDPSLLDLLHALRLQVKAQEPFHVISGFRSRRTNATLRSKSAGVAKYSLHMEGKAIDIRVPDVGLGALRDQARRLRRGGVGFYPASNFVHVDTGRVRIW